MIYKYINQEQTIVAVYDENGISNLSGLASALVPEGVTPEPYVEPPAPIPAVVSRAQARKALAIQGLLTLVQPAIDSISDPLQRTLVQIDWDDAQVYERNNPTLMLLAAALGLTEQQLDTLFLEASQL